MSVNKNPAKHPVSSNSPKKDWDTFVRQWLWAHEKGWSYAELAEEMGVSRPTVQSRRVHLRRHMGIDLPSLKHSARIRHAKQKIELNRIVDEYNKKQAEK